MSERTHDVVIYGSTGFTGRLVAEYLSKEYGDTGDIKWAMAGRSDDKLKSVRDEMGVSGDVPLVVANANDENSLRDMVKSTKVVLTTVGPYQLYGSDLVRICAEEGTDYVDLCGEPAWMRQMIDAHEETAKKSGARIVFSCGFDSIPSDLGVLLLQNTAKEKFGHAIDRVKCRVRGMKGTFSGGTAASLKATMAAAMQNPEILGYLKNPHSLVPGFEGPRQPSGSKPYLDEEIGMWVTPFVMAAINTKNVHRTNALLGHAYGEGLLYDEMVVTGPGEKGEMIAKKVAADKGMMSDGGPKPGEGPSKEERENGSYDLLFRGEGEDGKLIHVGVTGDKDPGYGSTSKMIAESAICLTQEAKDAKGGVWTPGAVMGEALMQRLKDRAGLTFEVELVEGAS